MLFQRGYCRGAIIVDHDKVIVTLSVIIVTFYCAVRSQERSCCCGNRQVLAGVEGSIVMTSGRQRLIMIICVYRERRDILIALAEFLLWNRSTYAYPRHPASPRERESQFSSKYSVIFNSIETNENTHTNNVTVINNRL